MADQTRLHKKQMMGLACYSLNCDDIYSFLDDRKHITLLLYTLTQHRYVNNNRWDSWGRWAMMGIMISVLFLIIILVFA